MADHPSEEQCESTICDWLVEHGGYIAVRNDRLQGAARDFDPARGLDTGDLLRFIGATQIDAWHDLLRRHGGDPDTAQAKFADRLVSELDRRGAVDVLRHGVVDMGVMIDATVVVDTAGQLTRKTAFYVRVGNATREISDPAERQKYVADRWDASSTA